MTPHSAARVLCAQVAPIVADCEANRVLATRAIGQAVDAGANIIILPELMTTGYHLTPPEATDLAETATGTSITAWQRALANSDAIVIGGFCERGSDEKIYNSAAVVSATELLAVYRKTHLWDQESRLFTPGTAAPPVVATRWGSIGVAICYDLFFPELTRTLALAGAQLLTVPTNSPSTELRALGSSAPADAIGHLMARTAAYVNRVYVAVCDRHGDERGHSWTGRSSIVDPEGTFVAGPTVYDEALLLADCRLSEANRKFWEGTTNDAFADRRPELYGSITAPTAPARAGT